MLSVYRIENEHGDEVVDWFTVEALKRLDAVKFRGTTQVEGARVYHYIVRSV